MSHCHIITGSAQQHCLSKLCSSDTTRDHCVHLQGTDLLVSETGVAMSATVYDVVIDVLELLTNVECDLNDILSTLICLNSYPAQVMVLLVSESLQML